MSQARNFQVRKSRAGKFTIPLLVTGAMAAVIGVTAVSTQAQQMGTQMTTQKNTHQFAHKFTGDKRELATLLRPGQDPHGHTLTATDGTKIMQTYDHHAFVHGTNAPLKDGQYKLTNGGTIMERAGASSGTRSESSRNMIVVASK